MFCFEYELLGVLTLQQEMAHLNPGAYKMKHYASRIFRGTSQETRFHEWNVFNGYPKAKTSIDSAKRKFMKDFELYQLKVDGSATGQQRVSNGSGQRVSTWHYIKHMEFNESARVSNLFYKMYTIYLIKKDADPC